MDPELTSALLELKRSVVRKVYKKRGIAIPEGQIRSMRIESPLEDFSPPERIHEVPPSPGGEVSSGALSPLEGSNPAREKPGRLRNFLFGLGTLALWLPSVLWAYSVVHRDGRYTLGQASILEWVFLGALTVSPYFVIIRWHRSKGSRAE